MPDYNLDILVLHLGHNATLGILIVLDWLLGIAVALRGGTFNIKLLPATIQKWAVDLFGLSVLAAAAGLPQDLFGVELGTVLNAAWWAISATYLAKVIAGFVEKAQGFTSPSQAKTYADKRADERAKGVN